MWVKFLQVTYSERIYSLLELSFAVEIFCIWLNDGMVTIPQMNALRHGNSPILSESIVLTCEYKRLF